eukprot:CAMPEP_0171429910 /NCGR_PEP_ID=MMETSP0881-20121228/6218_1 /TAXON_ID=67004 /ORGANISM="Thalassiosira weissflogii, Strain CCMP1336" /LENGTH=57 /DNA_ID=CAMNT_0011949943 /DNA_START=80 /DNA_END=254 /DNA_ORIENTATION=+
MAPAIPGAKDATLMLPLGWAFARVVLAVDDEEDGAAVADARRDGIVDVADDDGALEP